MNDSLSLSPRQTRQGDWLDISMDSPRCIAGERFSGEIILNLTNNTENLSISLKSKGTESILIKEQSGNKIDHSISIFTLNSVICEKVENHKVQSIFPFTFKLPVFSPATFNFADKDSEGNQIEVSVVYEIEAILYSRTEDVLKCNKQFFVFNRNTRKVLNGGVSQDTLLSSCFCCAQGISRIVLNYVDNEHPCCAGSKNYRVAVESPLNRKLENMMGQVLFEIVVQVPGGRQFELTRIISRSVPGLGSIIEASDNVERLGLDFEVDLEQATFGSNPCSNEGALFLAEYKLQFYANYAVGCRMKSACCVMSLHVNPQAPVKDNIELPYRWEPTEHLIANLIVEASNGVPYPQGTVVVSRKRE